MRVMPQELQKESDAANAFGHSQFWAHVTEVPEAEEAVQVGASSCWSFR